MNKNILIIPLLALLSLACNERQPELLAKVDEICQCHEPVLAHEKQLKLAIKTEDYELLEILDSKSNIIERKTAECISAWKDLLKNTASSEQRSLAINSLEERCFETAMTLEQIVD